MYYFFFKIIANLNFIGNNCIKANIGWSIYNNNIFWQMLPYYMFNRPGVAEAVLQPPSSLNDSVSQWYCCSNTFQIPSLPNRLS